MQLYGTLSAMGGTNINSPSRSIMMAGNNFMTSDRI